MVRTTFPSSLSLPPAGPRARREHLPFELLVDIFTVASFISLLHPPLRRNSGPILDSCSPQRGGNIHEAVVVGWLIVFWPRPIVLRNNEARTLRLSLGALTEILALALAARNKRSLSDEGKNSAPRQFLGQPAFAPYPLIMLCPEAGGGRQCGQRLSSLWQDPQMKLIHDSVADR